MLKRKTFFLVLTILSVIITSLYLFIYYYDIDTNIFEKENENIDNIIDIYKNNKKININNSINPLIINPKCRNAIIEIENIDLFDKKNENIIKTSLNCDEFNGGIYTREGIDAFNKSLCSWRGNLVRSHQLVINQLNFDKETNFKLLQDSIKNNETIKKWIKEFPIYYMLPKGGSSSIWKILKSTNKYEKYGQITQSQIHQNAIFGSKCSFIFVRSPIDRVLSGYYTLNAKLWRSMESNFNNYYNETFRKQRQNFPNWTFIIKEEPLRFETFINELIESPKKFTDSMHHNHITSTTEIFQKHLGNKYTDLHFIGKVENFTNDFKNLMKKCSNYFNFETDVKILKKEYLSHQMRGFGWAFPKSWNQEWKYHLNWLKYMGLFPIYNYWKINKNIDNILPPAYFILYKNYNLYKKIIKYYYQDIVCWKYENEVDFDFYRNKINGTYINIYTDSKYNFIPSDP